MPHAKTATTRSREGGQNMPHVGGTIGSRRLHFDVIAADRKVMRPAITPPVFLPRIAHLVSTRHRQTVLRCDFAAQPPCADREHGSLPGRDRGGRSGAIPRRRGAVWRRHSGGLDNDAGTRSTRGSSTSGGHVHHLDGRDRRTRTRDPLEHRAGAGRPPGGSARPPRPDFAPPVLASIRRNSNGTRRSSRSCRPVFRHDVA